MKRFESGSAWQSPFKEANVGPEQGHIRKKRTRENVWQKRKQERQHDRRHVPTTIRRIRRIKV